MDMSFNKVMRFHILFVTYYDILYYRAPSADPVKVAEIALAMHNACHGNFRKIPKIYLKI